MPAWVQPTRLRHHRHREVVLGVDAHKDADVAAVVSTTGKLIGTRSFPTTADGYRQLLDRTRSEGVVNRAGVECTGSYGAALSRFLRGHGLVVVEVNQPDKAIRRRRGKTDAVDAEAAAHAVLSGRATASDESNRPLSELRAGETVQATITSHQPWGITVRLNGYEPVGASRDTIRRGSEPVCWLQPSQLTTV